MKTLFTALAVCASLSLCMAESEAPAAAPAAAATKAESAAAPAAAVQTAPAPVNPAAIPAPKSETTEATALKPEGSQKKLNDPTDGDYDKMNQNFYHQKYFFFMKMKQETYETITWNKFM